MQNWISIKTEPPYEGQIVFIKRTYGGIYLGHRTNNPLSTNQDASRECWWYGSPVEDFSLDGNSKLRFFCNFSDVTVNAWMPLILPNNEQEAQVSDTTKMSEE